MRFSDSVDHVAEYADRRSSQQATPCYHVAAHPLESKGARHHFVSEFWDLSTLLCCSALCTYLATTKYTLKNTVLEFSCVCEASRSNLNFRKLPAVGGGQPR